MPLHIDAYLADTGHLTTLEHGAYLLLIMHYWRNGGLPGDEALIRRYARLSVEQWSKSRHVLAALFNDGWQVSRGCAAYRASTKPGRPAIPVDIRRYVMTRDGLVCAYCGDKEGPFHLDHIHPISRGGENTAENLCVACQACNCSKGALTADEFMGLLQ